MAQPSDSVLSTPGVPSAGAQQTAHNLEVVAGKGSAWLTLINILSRGVQMLMTIVLAAIFTEHQMGLVALVLAIYNISLVLTSMGVYDVISHAGEPRPAAGTVATLTVGLSVLVAAIAFIGAPAFAELLGAPDAVDLIRVCFIALPFNAYAGVQIAYLHRGLNFRRRLIPDAGTALTGAGVTLALAFAGFGVMASAIGMLAGAVVGPALGLLIGIRVPFLFHPRLARQTVHWATLVGPAAILALLIQNIDYMVVTRVLDAAATGVYSVGYRIAILPYLIIGIVLGSVAIPVYTQLRRDGQDDRIPGMIARFLGLTGATVIGIAVVVAAMAEHVDLLGVRWSAAVLPMRLLCLFTIGLSLLATLVNALRACGMPRRFLASQILQFVLLVPLLILGTRYFGIVGAAAAQVVAVGLVTAVVAFWVRGLGIGLRQMLASLTGPLVAAAVTLALAAVVGWLVPHRGPDVVAALWQGVLYTVAFLLVLALVDRKLFGYVLSSVPGGGRIAGVLPRGRQPRHRAG